MRLLYLTRGYGIHDRRFLRAFVRHGVDVAFLSLEDHSAAMARSHMPKGVSNLGHLGLLPGCSTVDLDAALVSFRRLALQFDPETVLAGPVHDSGYLLARAGLQVPWVVQSWAFDVFWEAVHRPDVEERSRHVLQATPALFADCAAVVRKCEEISGTSLSEHIIMPWGIEPELLRLPQQRTALRSQLDVDGRIVILCTRGMETIYGVETLLRAFLKTHRHNPNTLLLWAADGSLKPTVSSFSVEHGLTDAIRLPGSLDHDRVLDLFTAADLYVSCAASDGTSISLLEAMFYGLPSIVSNVGGNPEWISSGYNGWLAPVGDAEGFSAALINACALSQECRSHMGAVSQKRVAKSADWCRNSTRLTAWLEALKDAQLT
jgi:glycosyltransferase involved in cell wall biosynthesis